MNRQLTGSPSVEARPAKTPERKNIKVIGKTSRQARKMSKPNPPMGIDDGECLPGIGRCLERTKGGTR